MLWKKLSKPQIHITELLSMRKSYSNCEVTTAIRQEIEATLLLPQMELEDREWQGN